MGISDTSLGNRATNGVPDNRRGKQKRETEMVNSVTECEEISWMGNCLVPLEDVCKCTLDEPISKAISYIIDNRHSHIPVLDESKRVVGVFSVSTLMEIVRRRDANRNSGLLASIKTDLDIENHKTEVFRFVSISSTVADVRRMYEEAKENGKHIGMFFVTDNGGTDESLHGIFTKWDFSKVSAKFLTTDDSINAVAK